MSTEPANNGEGGQETVSSTTNPDQTKHSRPPSPPRASRSTSSIPQLTRSRKGSQEFSPTRTNALSGALSTIPSAAAVQRALSAQRLNAQPLGVDGLLEGARNDRTSIPAHNTPSWPTSPRVKSPPPSASSTRNSSSKRPESEHTPSNTSIKRLSAATNSEPSQTSDAGKELGIPSNTTRGGPRGASSAQATALETVAEGSVPTTPFIGPTKESASDSTIETPFLDRSIHTIEPSTIIEEEASGDGESRTPTDRQDTNGKKPRTQSTSAPPASLAKRSLTSLSTGKPKATEPPRTMTVETEPVASNPQLLGAQRETSGRDGAGSVRTKPSSETIRPKKEKKKPSRKAPSLHSATGTSKADIFEAKVASAVDEADTSDSDETFVYESNPPDVRGARHHSRTPSATSLVSQEHRNRHGIRSGSHVVGGKKSMKFSNSATSNYLEDENNDSNGRSSTRNSTPRHHHIGRHGKNGHASILDNNSPFKQPSKGGSPRASQANLSKLARPNSPQVFNGRVSSSPKKGNSFDIYDNVADDERTPLMGSVRINRNRHSRRPNGSALRHSEYFEDEERSVWSRMAGFVVLGLVVLVVCIGVATFVIGLNQPLLAVHIRHMQNVLASEQELMLDLHVDAVNSNIFAISVNDLDINLFAESAYVGTSKGYVEAPRQLRWASRGADNANTNWNPFSPDDGVDEGTDPIDDPDTGIQKMLLGRILEFDSPLVFDASPLRRMHSSSVGEIRLAKPGNKTEVGGSARWERVLQHDFNLIVRGVLKYQLPLSSKTRSVKIASRVKVQPGDDDNDKNGDDDDGAVPDPSPTNGTTAV